MFADSKEEIFANLNGLNAIQVYAGLPEELKRDRDIAKRVMSLDGLALAFAPDSIRHDEEIIAIAVRNERLARLHALAPERQLQEVA